MSYYLCLQSTVKPPVSDHPKRSRQGGRLWEVMIAYESLGQLCSLLEYEGVNEVNRLLSDKGLENITDYRQNKRKKIPTSDKNIYLLLTEFEVRTVSYAPSFFPFDLWPKREARGP